MNSTTQNIDYWIACSGGVDSVVLVRLFKTLNKNFGILHCNFKLRGKASDEDEQFVRNLAVEMNVPIKVKTFKVQEYIAEKGGNTQLAARNLRYQWFEVIKKATNAQVALGQHKDDQVETFLLQLRRGGKLRGLSAMKSYNNGFIRPLLKYSKEDIYALARTNKWKWREDLSNQKSDYLRNFYRNELIPIFQRETHFKAKVIHLVNDFQSTLLVAEQYLNQSFNFSHDVRISFNDWDAWPYWIKHLFISKSGIAPISVKEIDRLRKSDKGKYLKNENKSIWNEGDYFVIKLLKDHSFNSDYEIQLCHKSDVTFNEGEVYIDKNKVSGKISLRFWKEGDAFQPLGMNGKKKVSKFLRDKKVPSNQKMSYPVIVDESDEVVGVGGICPGELFKVDDGSKILYKVLKI